jgi:hypothetical protein
MNAAMAAKAARREVGADRCVWAGASVGAEQVRVMAEAIQTRELLISLRFKPPGLTLGESAVWVVSYFGKPGQGLGHSYEMRLFGPAWAKI